VLIITFADKLVIDLLPSVLSRWAMPKPCFRGTKAHPMNPSLWLTMEKSHLKTLSEEEKDRNPKKKRKPRTGLGLSFLYSGGFF